MEYKSHQAYAKWQKKKKKKKDNYFMMVRLEKVILKEI
jgi:hypothetical protein